jgi:hypothetical protein
MRNVIEVMDTSAIRSVNAGVNIPLLTTYGQGTVTTATGYRNTVHAWRTIWTTRSTDYDLPREIIETRRQKASAFLLVLPTVGLHSTASISGYLSGHWMPQAAILEYTAKPEIELAAKKAGGRKVEGSHGMLYSLGDKAARGENGTH